MPSLPDLPDFPHTDVPRGRLYRITDDVELAVFHVEAALPGAPAGFFVYAFMQGRHVVGSWDWTADAGAIARIAEIFRWTSSTDYQAPQHLAPGGEVAQIRPPIQDLLAHAMDDARPSSSVRSIDLQSRTLVIRIEKDEG